MAREAVIAAAFRTPIGKRNGALKGWHPVDLSGHVLAALAERTGIDPALVDDVIWGVVNQVGEQAHNVGRSAVLAAGWPESVPGTTVDRQCGSSQQSIHFAAAGVVSGQYDLAVAGGVESMTRIPMGSGTPEGTGFPFGPKVFERYNTIFNQGVGAEMIAKKWKLSRAQLDEFSLGSHEKAIEAINAGRFADQIIPVPVTGDDGSLFSFDTDQGVRPGGSLESLGKLKPAFDPEGVITAGNASQISDGAAALLVTTPERAAELGLTPLVRVHTAVLAGDDPVLMLTGPIPATAKALKRSGLRLDEIGAFEVNEAFASVPLAWLAETGADPKALNPLGGAIALGHPLGGSGAQLATRLIHHMVDNGIRYGLQTMCEGGGTANATIFELI
jgi:acetyl-CoA acyltransferase